MDAQVSEEHLITEYSQSLKEGHAVLFIGSGLSLSPFEDSWHTILSNIATELDLGSPRMDDFVELVQYFVNEKGKFRLQQLFSDSTEDDPTVTLSHKIIARLPIDTLWTTNYDRQLETAFQNAGRLVETRYKNKDVVAPLSDADVVIYKMHGDSQDPDSLCVSRDDQESFELDHAPLLEKLHLDLTRKNFLFLGLNFSDPYISYILSRLRVVHAEKPLTHYCVLKRPVKKPDETDRDFTFRERQFFYRVKDLRRYNIKTMLVEEYDEVASILKKLSAKQRDRNIFVSGCAYEYGSFGAENLNEFARALGRRITKKSYNLISGYGKGLAEQVILGALDGLHSSNAKEHQGRYIVWPFPSTYDKETYHNHRLDLITQSNIVIFLCGNRLNRDTKEVELSPGVLEEFKIAKSLNRFPIPVGIFEYQSEKIWEEVHREMDTHFPNMDVMEELTVLGSKDSPHDRVLDAIFAIVDKVVASTST